MQKLKPILIAVLIIFLSGCRDNFPTINPQVRCVNVLMDSQIIDGTTYYSGYCRCHLYEWSSDRIGRIGDSVDYSLEKCNKLIGFEPDTYEKVWTWWESIRLWLNRNKQNQSSFN